MSSVISRLRAYAPGSVGNVGPGLDILGLAIAGRGDTVLVERSSKPGVRVRDPGHPNLPTDPARNTAAIAAAEVLSRVSAGADLGLDLTVRKGLPLSGGMGGSAASAVAAAVATNGLLHNPLWPSELIECCLVAEERVSGRHADNIAASLIGGLVLLRSEAPREIIKIPVPQHLRVVLVNPAYQVKTERGRAALPETIPRDLALQQAAQVAALVAACYQQDLGLLGRAVEDRIAEPARAELLPGFPAAKAAAESAGALGCSISGAGPTVFALAHSETIGVQIAEAMREAYQSEGIASATRVAKVDYLGARLVPEEAAVSSAS